MKGWKRKYKEIWEIQNFKLWTLVSCEVDVLPCWKLIRFKGTKHIVGLSGNYLGQIKQSHLLIQIIFSYIWPFLKLAM